MADRASGEAGGRVWSALKNLAVRPKSTNNTTSLPALHYNSVNISAIQRLNHYDSPIFEVDINRSQLYYYFHEALGLDLRQPYNCNTCASFVYRYGPLVLVDDAGDLHTLFGAPKIPTLILEFALVLKLSLVKSKVVRYSKNSRLPLALKSKWHRL